MKNTSTLLSHIEINVSDYAKSIRFYDKILKPLGWERWLCTNECTIFCDGFLKLILSPLGPRFSETKFHRKHAGLNHLAFYAPTQQAVDDFCEKILRVEAIPILYGGAPQGDETYYSVLFEDPDRIKIELVFAPLYCEPGSWPNNLVSDFDPYK